jgi:glycopeptide antibiotics resistance protein
MVTEDKLMHGAVGFFLGIVFAKFFPGIIGLLAVWLVCLGYEVFQYATDSGTMEIADALIGGVMGTLGWLSVPKTRFR